MPTLDDYFEDFNKELCGEIIYIFRSILGYIFKNIYNFYAKTTAKSYVDLSKIKNVSTVDNLITIYGGDNKSTSKKIYSMDHMVDVVTKSYYIIKYYNKMIIAINKYLVLAPTSKITTSAALLNGTFPSITFSLVNLNLINDARTDRSLKFGIK